MDEKSRILNEWRRAKKLNEQSKNPEVSRKLNRFLITKNNTEKLSLLDEAIQLLEEGKKEQEYKAMDKFKEILSSESFLRQYGKAQVIGVEDTNINNKNIYEKLGIAKNDDMKNYQVFKLLTKSVEHNETNQKNKEGFNSIYKVLEECKYFEVPDNINWMLCNTKNKVSQIRLPYIYMFFDTKVIIEDITYYGLLLGDISQLKEMSEESKELEHIDLLPDGIIIQTFYDSPEGTGWIKFMLYEKSTNRKLNKLKEYIMNLIYFINSEDIKIMVHNRSEKNTQRRIQNNKVPIPSYNKIQIIGYLAKYLDKIESVGMGKGFTHRFTVRGHWRHFWNKKFDNLYKLYNYGKLNHIEGKQYLIDDSGSLKVWIYPYIKGRGILINKTYELK